uniref:Uncharacterized protein n=1 Tax=Lactuca sativa TaxID=4236 RepID=A0A9R1W2S1_LACSA|nr:hypothetical protein LSAT_V11C300123310 [Lactuca sativa]
MGGGGSLAELCCDSLKDFNPMVHVSVEKGDLSSFGVDFFEKLMLWLSIAAYLQPKKLSKRVAFYSVDCRVSCGEIFVDLQKYCYAKIDETIECPLQYQSFEEAIAIPWRSLPKRMSKLYFAMRERFEEVKKRKPGETSIADMANVLKLRNELCLAHSLNESEIPDTLLERLVVSKQTSDI